MLKTHPSELIERGWHLLPVEPNDKNPFTKFAYKGLYSATNNPEQIDKWLTKKPDLNWGVACEMSGLIVLDFDFRAMDGQADEFYQFCDQVFYEQTYVVQTGDGIHYYFKAPKGLSVRGKVFNGLDVKYRGYVVTEGSIHPNGATYTHQSQQEPMQITDKLLERITR